MKPFFRHLISIILVIMMTTCLAGTVVAEEAEATFQEDIPVTEIPEEIPEAQEEFTVSEVFDEAETEEPAVPEIPAEEDFSEIPEVIDVSEPAEEEPPLEPVYEEPTEDPEEFIVLEEMIVSEDSVEEEFLPLPEVAPVSEDPYLIPLTEQVFSDSEEADETVHDETNYLSYSSSMAKGKYNISVYRLQLRLEQLGYLSSGQADGYFGDYTEGAVRLFQAENGQYVDGVVGELTIDCLNNSAKPFYKLTKGMYSWPVYYMQQELVRLGYLDTPADGDFGTYTYTALCLFQACNGLNVTGKGNLSTLLLLFSGTGNSNSFRNIGMGMEGTDVAVVQYYLQKLGYYTGGVDGGYGAMSAASVSLFQAYNGWTYAQISSTVDVITYLVMVSSIAKPFKVLSEGDTGQTVNIIQNYLKDLGFLSSISGIFDDTTVEALKQFQKANKLTQNGIPSIQTLEKLFSISAEGADDIRFEVGSSGETVRQIQQQLYNLGYMVTAPDGYFGSSTYAAVCAFQAQNGSYYPDGVVNRTVYKKIMSSSEYFTPLWEGSPVCSAVYAMQVVFARNHMIKGADGEFGYTTKLDVCQIQKMFNLPVTEVADATTLYYVYNLESFFDNRYNVQNYSSNTSWLVFINTTTNRCYIYNGRRGNWNLVYNWICSTGADETPTVVGEFTTNFRSYTFTDGITYSVYYTTSFYGPYYIHSILYKPYSWEIDDPRMGLDLSHGCVRLETENAIWFYNNIPLGTKVVVVQ